MLGSFTQATIVKNKQKKPLLVKLQNAKKKRKRRIRVTSSGVSVLLVSLVMLGVALSTGYDFAFYTFGILLGMIIVDGVVARINFAKIDITRNLPDTIWQNNQFLFEYRITNNKRWFCANAIQVFEAQTPECSKYEFGLFRVSVSPNQTSPTGRWVWAESRGLLILEDVAAESLFPLGLSRITKKIEEPHVITIWPAKGKLKLNPLVMGAHSTSDSTSNKKGGDDEFYALREYRQGDDLRWVHWRKSASRKKLVIKEMSQPNPNAIMLLLDFTGYNTAYDYETVEKILRFAATMIDQCIHHFDYEIGIGIIYEGRYESIRPSKGIEAHNNLLNYLASLNLIEFYQEVPNDPDSLLEQLTEMKGKQTRKIYVNISGATDDSVSSIVCTRNSLHIPSDSLDAYYADNFYYATKE